MIPDWLTPLATQLPNLRAEDLSRHPIPEGASNAAAVLILFGPNDDHGDLLIIERASTMAAHAGQPAFPGGRIEESDSSRVATALREAQEETGLNPSSVHVIGELPELWLPPSGFRVTPVVGWWHDPHELAPTATGEVTAIHRVPIRELASRDNRVSVRHPSAGYVGPGFEISNMLIWGFTGGLVAGLIRIGGWSQPWDIDRIVEVRPLKEST